MMEELFGKAKKVANAAGKKTGELVEISKLKLSAMQVNTDIKALYEKLGSAVYSMNKAHYENSELLESLIEEIDEKRAELKKINDKIAVLQKAKECPCCQTKNPQTAFYRLLILLTMTVVTAAAHVVATAIAMQRILIRKNNQSFANE